MKVHVFRPVPSGRARNHRLRGKMAGFTLVELAIAMVLMAIIGGIAVASYRSYSFDARRTTALTALTDAASRQEQFFLDNKTYSGTVGSGGLNIAATVEGGYYTLSIVTPTAACPLNRCWVMQATPLGTQIEDSCATLSYNSDGDKTPAGCW